MHTLQCFVEPYQLQCFVEAYQDMFTNTNTSQFQNTMSGKGPISNNASLASGNGFHTLEIHLEDPANLKPGMNEDAETKEPEYDSGHEGTSVDGTHDSDNDSDTELPVSKKTKLTHVNNTGPELYGLLRGSFRGQRNDNVAVFMMFYTMIQVASDSASNGLRKVPVCYNATGFGTARIHQSIFNFRDKLMMIFRSQWQLPRSPSKGGRMVLRYPFIQPGWYMVPGTTENSLSKNWQNLVKLNEKGHFGNVKVIFQTYELSNNEAKIILENLKENKHTMNTVDLSKEGLEIK